MRDFLWDFALESNKIEGILGVTDRVYQAHHDFLSLDKITIHDLKDFVEANAPGHLLRDSPEVPGVRVGNHIAPPSGPGVRAELSRILRIEDPYRQHVAYEDLHPFTDGNGRSGRVLWLWNMIRAEKYSSKLGFLHHFYYQTLGARQ